KGVKKLGSEDSVGLGMFENCKSLKEITIPDSVGYIQPNAFDGCSNVTILGAEDSYAQTFALEQQLPFMAMIDTDCIVGDVSGDGNVDITDATIVQQFAAEVFVPTALQRLAADTNGDGNVDITDATLIQMLAAEIINKF
ncbi:MAG: leucine-rich repeat protein, partial [Ruminococcus sp.]|nr:leucine-rich repeat protein [Ruminococcus sp.]